ncbi:MAG TPA: Fic family protein [Chloroflexota bacterium]|nr:Fic family protein [Chloroflexota bacterium]
MAGEAHPSPYYVLTAEDVVAIYADLLDYSVAEARDLLRSPSGLEGAVGRLQAHIDYDDADLATLAAVLAHGIAEGQHFLDGNKRLGAAAMLAFVELNSHTLDVRPGTVARWIIDLSFGLTVAELAAQIRSSLVPAASG